MLLIILSIKTLGTHTAMSVTGCRDMLLLKVLRMNNCEWPAVAGTSISTLRSPERQQTLKKVGWEECKSQRMGTRFRVENTIRVLPGFIVETLILNNLTFEG